MEGIPLRTLAVSTIRTGEPSERKSSLFFFLLHAILERLRKKACSKPSSWRGSGAPPFRSRSQRCVGRRARQRSTPARKVSYFGRSSERTKRVEPLGDIRAVPLDGVPSVTSPTGCRKREYLEFRAHLYAPVVVGTSFGGDPVRDRLRSRTNFHTSGDYSVKISLAGCPGRTT